MTYIQQQRTPEPKQSPIVPENLPVCGNYHSLSRDRKIVDPAHSAGKETLAQQIERRIELYKKNKS